MDKNHRDKADNHLPFASVVAIFLVFLLSCSPFGHVGRLGEGGVGLSLRCEEWDVQGVRGEEG